MLDRAAARSSKRDEMECSRTSVAPEAMVFWIAIAGSVVLTLVARRLQLFPGEVTTMQWVGTHLSGSLSVAGPVLDTAFTGLMPPLLFVMLVAAVWWRWGRYPAALLLLAGSVTGLTKLADLVRRPRPNDDLTWGEIVVGEGGYPSGHVVYTVMVFGMLTHLASRHVDRPATRHLLRGGFLVLIVVTGPSRLIEGDHWPADVVAGYTIAIAGLAGMIWIDRRMPAVLDERAPRVHRWLQLDR
jgi:membrane-associated phospholipid phosphatase